MTAGVFLGGRRHDGRTRRRWLWLLPEGRGCQAAQPSCHHGCRAPLPCDGHIYHVVRYASGGKAHAGGKQTSGSWPDLRGHGVRHGAPLRARHGGCRCALRLGGVSRPRSADEPFGHAEKASPSGRADPCLDAVLPGRCNGVGYQPVACLAVEARGALGDKGGDSRRAGSSLGGRDLLPGCLRAHLLLLDACLP